LRDEDKEEGEDSKEGSWFLGETFEKQEEEEEIMKEIGKKEQIGRTIVLGNSHRALLLMETLGLRARKPKGLLELGSQRGCS
jgi:hypothetical protein